MTLNGVFMCNLIFSISLLIAHKFHLLEYAKAGLKLKGINLEMKLENLSLPKNLDQILKEIEGQGGTPLLVGGAVRDAFLGIQSKDIDIEVHGITLNNLQKVLEKFGPVSEVGKSFGVLRLHNVDIDWSIPRKDKSGRHPEVVLDQNLDLKEAFARRDLTINSMGVNLLNGELIDLFSGAEDLKNKNLKATDPNFFVEDPLRFFRVMQFVGRLEFQPDEQLNELCKKIDLSKISKERISNEFEKLFLKSKRPSLGIKWLKKIGRLNEILPELQDTIGVEQNPEYHPEGDVFEHLMQALDFAAIQNYNSEEEKLLMVCAALCHDLGKAVSTKVIDGKIRSIGHEDTGEPLAKKMMSRITEKKDLINNIAKLTKFHMKPGNYLRNGAKDSTYKKLAWMLAPDITMMQLYQLFCADILGRNQAGGNPLQGPDENCESFLKKAIDLGILKEPEKHLLSGKDLQNCGVKPGPKLGDILKEAYLIQLEKGIKSKEVLLQKVLDKQKV